ncbi:hypothetical protein CC2G_013659 [Coprinopsis cinerea AmutBmut pab1-1]|nr:hypothetical protein CC2G_013659 [Coprinopsis cinerea AmutBmut pab1-1]
MVTGTTNDNPELWEEMTCQMKGAMSNRASSPLTDTPTLHCSDGIASPPCLSKNLVHASQDTDQSEGTLGVATSQGERQDGERGVLFGGSSCVELALHVCTDLSFYSSKDPLVFDFQSPAPFTLAFVRMRHVSNRCRQTRRSRTTIECITCLTVVSPDAQPCLVSPRFSILVLFLAVHLGGAVLQTRRREELPRGQIFTHPWDQRRIPAGSGTMTPAAGMIQLNLFHRLEHSVTAALPGVCLSLDTPRARMFRRRRSNFRVYCSELEVIQPQWTSVPEGSSSRRTTLVPSFLTYPRQPKNEEPLVLLTDDDDLIQPFAEENWLSAIEAVHINLGSITAGGHESFDLKAFDGTEECHIEGLYDELNGLLLIYRVYLGETSSPLNKSD